eukprot:10770412-Alexandrium_andersonii.AAC.1
MSTAPGPPSGSGRPPTGSLPGLRRRREAHAGCPAPPISSCGLPPRMDGCSTPGALIRPNATTT